MFSSAPLSSSRLWYVPLHLRLSLQKTQHPTAIPTEVNGGNHTPAFAKAVATIEVHNACLDLSKALAATGVLADDEFFAKVRSAWVERPFALTVL